MRFRYSQYGMSNGRFSLFPGAPSLHRICSPRGALRYQWRSNGDPVITSAIIMAVCVAVWVVEAVLSLFWPLGLAMP